MASSSETGYALFGTPPSKRGPEFPVNTSTSGDQHLSSVAGLANGGFIVTWEGDLDGGNGPRIFGQRYGKMGDAAAKAAGKARGPEFRITDTSDWEHDPSVTGLANDGFVVAWRDGTDVLGQRFSKKAVRQGPLFQVGSIAGDGFQSVARIGNGKFVITWDSCLGSSCEIYGQIYNKNGAAVGDAFLVNTHTLNDQLRPSVAGLADGGFVVTWDSLGQDGSDLGVYGQRYNKKGVARRREFRINSHKNKAQWRPSAVGLANGGFAVAWQSDGGLHGDNADVYGQRFDENGKKAGSEFRINTLVAGAQQSPSVGGLEDGGFIATWQSAGQDSSGNGVYGQRFNEIGLSMWDEFQINTTTEDNQQLPAIAGLTTAPGLSEDAFVVTWGSNNQDGSGLGVYGQRYYGQ